MRSRGQTIKLSRQLGFTLLELIIVVAIIGIMAVFVNFSYSSANSRLKNAARDLYSNMQNARMEAVKRNTNWGIIFNNASNSYTICAYSAGTCTGNTTTVNLDVYGSGVQFGYGSATKNATTSGGACSANCPADGISYSANSVFFDFNGINRKRGYVYLENNKESSLTVATPNLTGNVLTKQWTGSDWE